MRVIKSFLLTFLLCYSLLGDDSGELNKAPEFSVINEILQSPFYQNVISSKDFDVIENDITQFQEKIDKRRPFLFYFVSDSVPSYSIKDFLISAYKISIIEPDLGVKLYVNGFLDFQDFTKKVIDFESDDPTNLKISSMFFLKMHPRRFKELQIKKVPVIAFAECSSINTYSDCDFKYIVRGDVDLAEALRLFAKKDKKFNEWERSIYDFED